MPPRPVVHSNTDVEFKPAPINPSWIVEGEPVARNAILSRSDDETACTILWECSAGTFRWHYDFDETIHFVEGGVTIDDGHGTPHTLGPGDMIFFPAGSQAVWTVEKYVRKVAFCRKVLPEPVGRLIRLTRRVKHTLSPPKDNGSLMSSN